MLPGHSYRPALLTGYDVMTSLAASDRSLSQRNHWNSYLRQLNHLLPSSPNWIGLLTVRAKSIPVSHIWASVNTRLQIWSLPHPARSRVAWCCLDVQRRLSSSGMSSMALCLTPHCGPGHDHLKLPAPSDLLPHPCANDLSCWSAVKQQLYVSVCLSVYLSLSPSLSIAQVDNLP